MSELFRDYLKRFTITAPWILYFQFILYTIPNIQCSSDLIDKIKFAYYYHLISTGLIILVYTIKRNSELGRVDLSKGSFWYKACKIIEMIQSVNAWISLVRLIMGLWLDCDKLVKNLLIFYFLAHLVIIAYPFIKYLIISQKIKTKKGKSQ